MFGLINLITLTQKQVKVRNHLEKIIRKEM